MAGLGKIDLIVKHLEPEISKLADNKLTEPKLSAVDIKDKQLNLKTVGGIIG